MRTYNSNEKLARNKSGLENATYFTVDGKSSDKLFEDEAKQKYNEQVNEFTNKLDKYSESLEEYGKKFNNTIEDLEIKAIGSNMLIHVFSENPFQKIKTSDSGIILDTGGMAPEYKSNETGELEEEKSFVHVGVVVDAGPQCKYIKEDDVIMWTVPSELPVPFFRQNLVTVNESRVLAVVGSKLTERFKNID